VARIRGLDLVNRPGVGEAVDWASALHMLGLAKLDRQVALDTLAALVKDVDDQQAVAEAIDDVVPDPTD
jgi:hypothetical protein